MQRVHVDDRAAFRDRLSQAARRRGDYQSEFRLALPDGQLRWIAALGRVDLDAKGNPLRSRGACIDITARKEAEQEMLRLRQDIAHVGRVSVMGQISAALAHEINQPLGAILRNAEAAALFMQHESPDLQEISAILEDIRKDDQRASAVIDRIRALLRHGEVVMTTLNVRSVLGDVATLLWPDAAARHVALELTVPADVPAVRGDPVQVGQVLLNLVVNGSTRRWRADRPRRYRHSAAEGGQRRDQGGRHRPRHRAGMRPHLRAVLHDQGQGHRHGAVDLARHHRGPWRAALGRERGHRRDISIHVADRELVLV